MPPRVLIVDDEVCVRRLLNRILSDSGFDVRTAADAREALASVRRERPDALILDYGLKDHSGDYVYTALRRTGETKALPILILTGLPREGLAAQCLNGGADAFLPKPFERDQLVAQVRALLRRGAAYADDEGSIEKGRIRIHSATRQVFLDESPVPHLAPKEFELLKLLVLQSPQVVDRRAIAGAVWRMPFPQLPNRTLDVHVRRIRQKLGPDSGRWLRSIPSLGYQWLEG